MQPNLQLGGKKFVRKRKLIATFYAVRALSYSTAILRAPGVSRKSSITAAGMAIQHAAEQWSGYCQRYAQRTRSTYRGHLARFIDATQIRTIGQITPLLLQTYINGLLAEHTNTGTNLCIAVLKSFCRWLSETYNCPNPAIKLKKLPSDTAEARCLTQAEYDRALSVAHGTQYHLLRFLANTGLRASELSSIKPAAVKGTWLTISGKGGKIRHIPFNKAAQESLPYVLNMSKSRYSLLRYCHACAEAAGLAPFGPHALRHYFATRLLAKGVPIHHVSKLLGHSSVVITEQIYYHFRPDHLAGLTDCLED